MKLLLSAVCAFTFGASAVPAPKLADFSGLWEMDRSRSEAAAQATPIGPVTVAIHQTPAELQIDTTRSGMLETVRYQPSGDRLVAGHEVPSATFRWEGSTLVTFRAVNIDNQTVTVTEVRSLD